MSGRIDKQNNIASNAAKGGIERAKRLTPEERSESARNAADARWRESSLLPKETHTGVLEIVPGFPMACGVLDSHGTKIRVLSNRGLGKAFGSKKTGAVNDGAPKIPSFLTSAAIMPFVSGELMVRLSSPVMYRPKHGGRPAYGYEASILPKLCGVIIDANAAKPLRQIELVKAANSMLRALAGVAIVALVDEATGYQVERVHDELQKLLQAYVVEEMRGWISVFPTEFFRQIYRLQHWEFKEGRAQKPRYIGKLINEWIYRRLPTPVLHKLQQLNPSINGRRPHKHHQFLTVETGIPHLDRQIASVTTLMRASSDRKTFERLLINAFPKTGEQLHLLSE